MQIISETAASSRLPAFRPAVINLAFGGDLFSELHSSGSSLPGRRWAWYPSTTESSFASSPILDRRLLLEFLPGLVFLAVNMVSTLYVATGAAILAAMLAVYLRYRIDGQLPFLALSTVLLSIVMLGAGLVQDDERFIKIKPTIGGVSFAVILAAGMLARPSMLQRSMGYKLEMIPTGWTVLHFAWIGLALALAGANELVWRNSSTDLWVTYNVVSGPVTFAIYFAITYAVAWWYWDEEEEEAA